MNSENQRIGEIIKPGAAETAEMRGFGAGKSKKSKAPEFKLEFKFAHLLRTSANLCEPQFSAPLGPISCCIHVAWSRREPSEIARKWQKCAVIVCNMGSRAGQGSDASKALIFFGKVWMPDKDSNLD
ncbi:hypothetical protein [Sphingobium estronivorans]|uniref:hypothetical protein n=1 Tax=Sphingobium estronivorans TaxID=1577690 RepID=UPI00123A1944|nr:hypothetical protein [Sphingobium estronivorans]